MSAFPCRPPAWLARWCRWIGHPDGPSFKKVWKHVVFCSLGAILFLSGSLVSFMSIAIALTTDTCDLPILCILNTYIGGAMMFIGISLWIVGKHPSRIDFKISEDVENLDSLISDIRSNLDKFTDERARIEALRQIRKQSRIRNMKMNVPVLRTTSLRTLQVQTYHTDELVSLLNFELENLAFYVGDRDDPSYLKYSKKIKKAIHKYAKFRNNAGELRRLLIILREEIDDLRHKYGYGEAIIDSVSYWGIFSGIALIILGLSPLLDKPYFQGNLTIIHWAILGLVGAIIATMNNINKKDTYMIAEDEGNSELKKMILGCFLGIMTSALLYLSIKAGVLGGEIFPALTEHAKPAAEQAEPIEKIRTNALSVLWAILFGFTGGAWLEGLFSRMVRS